MRRLDKMVDYWQNYWQIYYQELGIAQSMIYPVKMVVVHIYVEFY